MLLMLDIADFHGLAVNQPELSAAIRERAVGRAERSWQRADSLRIALLVRCPARNCAAEPASSGGSAAGAR